MKTLSKHLRIILQVTVMVAIIAALLWYVGISSLISTLSQMKLEYLPLAFLAYFFINLLFAFRLKRVIGREGVKTGLKKPFSPNTQAC